MATKLVNGIRVPTTAGEDAQRVSDEAEHDARAARPKDQKVEEDIFNDADFIHNPVFRAIIAEILSHVQTPPTKQQFRDGVKARLVADPDVQG